MIPLLLLLLATGAASAVDGSEVVESAGGAATERSEADAVPAPPDDAATDAPADPDAVPAPTADAATDAPADPDADPAPTDDAATAEAPLPVDVDALAADERAALALIEACRAGRCDADRVALGRAFLTCAIASSALCGQIDEVAAANGRLLAPDLAAELAPVLPSERPADPEPWVERWLVAPGDPTPVDLLDDTYQLDPSELELDPPEALLDSDRTDEAVLRDPCEIHPLGPAFLFVEVRGETAYLRSAFGGRGALARLRGSSVEFTGGGSVDVDVDGDRFRFRSGLFNRWGHDKRRGHARIGPPVPLVGQFYSYTPRCTADQVRLGVISLRRFKRRRSAARATAAPIWEPAGGRN